MSTSKKMRDQINNLSIHLNILEQQEQSKTKTCTGKEIIKFQAEIMKLKQKNRVGPLKGLFKNRQILSWTPKDENGRLNYKWRWNHSETAQIQRIISNYLEKWNTSKLEDAEKMDRFLETHELPKVNHGNTETLKSQKAGNKTRVLKTPWTGTVSGPNGAAEFHKKFTELMAVLFNFFHVIKRGHCQTRWT